MTKDELAQKIKQLKRKILINSNLEPYRSGAMPLDKGILRDMATLAELEALAAPAPAPKEKKKKKKKGDE